MEVNRLNDINNIHDMQSTQSESKDSFLTAYYRFNFVFNYTAIFGIVAHSLLIFLFIIIGIKEMALYNILSSLSWYLIYRINKKGNSKIAFGIGYLEVVLHSALGIFFMGWGSGFHYFLFSTVTVLFYMPNFKKISKITISLTSIILYIFLFNLFYNTTPVYLLNDSVLNIIYYSSIIITFTMLSVLAHLYSMAAKKAENKLKELNKKLKSIASTDHLTGLVNRRSMINIIEKSIMNYKKNNIPFSIIIGDIDDFKRINDLYGHNRGDRVLKTIADLLKDNLRKNDTLARWGGEEFLILLSDTNYEEACTVAKKLKESLTDFYHDNLNETEHLSMTFGISQFKGDLDRCISEADKALYKGKKDGKDCVVIYNKLITNE